MPKNKFENFSFNVIHETLVNHKKNHKILGSNLKNVIKNTFNKAMIDTLVLYLGRINYQGSPLTLEKLAGMEVKDAIELCGGEAQYRQPMILPPRDIYDKTMAEIHREVSIDGNTPRRAALSLGTTARTLRSILTKYFNISFEELRDANLSEDNAKKRWPNYYLPLKQIALPKPIITIQSIHQAILYTNNRTAAASKLGIDPKGLIHLLEALPKNQLWVATTYDEAYYGLKTILTKEQAEQQVWGKDIYNQPLKWESRIHNKRKVQECKEEKPAKKQCMTIPAPTVAAPLPSVTASPFAFFAEPVVHQESFAESLFAAEVPQELLAEPFPLESEVPLEPLAYPIGFFETGQLSVPGALLWPDSLESDDPFKLDL